LVFRKEAHTALSARESDRLAQVVVDHRPITVAFYTCGDNGRQYPARRFGTRRNRDGRIVGGLDATNVYNQLAECLASPDHAYPRLTTAQAVTNQTFGVREATEVFNRLPEGTQVEKVYFIGHGTGVPSAYYFSGRPVANRHDFQWDAYNQLFFLSTNYSIGTFENNYDGLREPLNRREIAPSVREVFGEWGFPLSGAARVQVQSENERWVVVDGNYRYPIRRDPEDLDDLIVIGEHTPHLGNCQALVTVMKRRLIPRAHIGFLTCFTASGSPSLIALLQQRIEQSQPGSPGIPDVTVGGYRDYFEAGWNELREGRIIVWHNRIINVDTDRVVDELEARGRCGENIIPHPYQETQPVVSASGSEFEDAEWE
jgi:hypothetical protein